MSPDEQELLLKQFVRAVENGSRPSEQHLKLVADGIKRFLKYQKPWQTAQGRKKRGTNRKLMNSMICAHLLNEIKVDRARIAMLMGNPSDSTIKRYIKDGKAICEAWSIGFYMCQFGVQELLKNYTLKPIEAARLEAYEQKLKDELDQLEQTEEEPSYF